MKRLFDDIRRLRAENSMLKEQLAAAGRKASPEDWARSCVRPPSV